MAQPTATSTLASAPSILDRLATEPPIEDDGGPVVNSMFGIPGLDDVIRGGLEIVIGRRNPAEVLPSIMPSIGELVQALRAGGVPIPMDQIARLGINSPEFYCIIGAGAAVPPAAPPHVIVTKAQGAHRDCPSLWYVNFPRVVSGADADAVRRSRKSMMNFRSWSSRKWWEEVGRRYGIADDPVQLASQSKQFAEIACEDMVKMSWLRTTNIPTTMMYNLDCDARNLHAQLAEKVMQNWTTVDSELVEAIEPVFQGIVRAVQLGSRESSQMKNVVMEKYVYEPSNRSITSYIRLLSFEVKDTVYDIIRGKGGERQSRVNIRFSVCFYEAVFEGSLWEQFSTTLHDDETNLLWDYVRIQTIDVQGSNH
ncbi:hypothetical protein B0H67DRAFT_640471 [Lasiosphaeris hirsuta]|uniref:Uncharacterized protein n=1 Tax=Lasiosphaeris hirsuta TaxID=260670 RepID=A0AA40EBI7_9PEZI|nr:hypothetical protein B0H67DRAFT_640471 [Lasiosphaeris hirsuta]